MSNSNLTCVVCDHPLGSHYNSYLEFMIVKCSECGLESTFPIPSAEALKTYYTDYFDFRADREVLKHNALRHIEELKKYGVDENSLVLDYGAGQGVFMDAFNGQCFGYDPFAKGRADLFHNLKEITINEFDLVTIWGALDCMGNPKSSVKEISNLIKTGGLLAFTVVSNELEIPYRYKPPEHLTYWTKPSTELFMEKLGFKILHLEKDVMSQRSDVYIKLICSRVPEIYHNTYLNVANTLPEYVEIPTNELFCIAKKL